MKARSIVGREMNVRPTSMRAMTSSQWLLSYVAVGAGLALGACSAGGSTGGTGDVTPVDPSNIGAPNQPGTPTDPGGTDAPGEGVGTPPLSPTDPTDPGTAAGGGDCSASEPGQPNLRRLSRRELESTLRDIFPVLGATWASTLSADTISDAGFDNDNTLLVVSRQTARELADTAESVGTAISGSLAQVLPCAATAPNAACAGQFLDAQGRRLFRRPLTADERTSYLAFFDTAFAATGDFAQGIAWLTRALIEAPQFVYRREIGVAQGATARLDQYEIASELAFTFSGKGPSDALLDRAAAGELASRDVLIATARELLVTEGREVVQSFFDSYVGHPRVTTIAKEGVMGFAERREDMLRETRRFIEEVVVNREGGPRELLTATFTTPSIALANFYQFGAAGGAAPAADYAVVERPEGRGIGLLAQGSVLATLAQPNGSSPTKRGLWVYKRLLCNDVPPVPPNIPELEPPQPGVRTTRQRYEEDHAQGSCQGCHGMWDPIGFGFEHFNEAGQYRANEGGAEIDTKSHVPQRGETLFEFDGQEDLMTQLAEQPIVGECMSSYVATFAFGEELECGGLTERAAFVDGSIGFIDYFASLAGEPHFLERRVQ